MSPVVNWQPARRPKRTLKGWALTLTAAAWCAGVFASVANDAWNIAVDLGIIGLCAIPLVAFFICLGPGRR